MAQLAIDLYSQMAEQAIPFTIGFEICNIIACTFIRAALGGRLWFGR